MIYLVDARRAPKGRYLLIFLIDVASEPIVLSYSSSIYLLYFFVCALNKSVDIKLYH